MTSNRDDVVSSYVRHRIRQWRDSGQEIQELARKAGLTKSGPSMVLKGTGVGAKTGPCYARAFDFEDYDALKRAAFAWWDSAKREPTGAMARAAEAVLGLGQGTPAQVETIFSAYAHERFRGRDYDWWLETLLAELRRDRDTLRQDKTLRTEISSKQKATRELQAEKKRPAVAPPKRRRVSGAA